MGVGDGVGVGVGVGMGVDVGVGVGVGIGVDVGAGVGIGMGVEVGMGVGVGVASLVCSSATDDRAMAAQVIRKRRVMPVETCATSREEEMLNMASSFPGCGWSKKTPRRIASAGYARISGARNCATAVSDSVTTVTLGKRSYAGERRPGLIR